MNLKPISPCCGIELTAKIGTKIVVCLWCNSEYHLTQIPKQKGLDEFLFENKRRNFQPDEISSENLEKWK